MEERTLNVKGMHCSSCEVLVTEALNERGVAAEASFKDSTIKVAYDPNSVSLESIRKIINEEGYEVLT